MIREWQSKTGTKWYDLDPQARSKINVAIKNQGLDGAVTLFLNESAVQEEENLSPMKSKPGTTESKRITRGMVNAMSQGMSTPRNPLHMSS